MMGMSIYISCNDLIWFKFDPFSSSLLGFKCCIRLAVSSNPHDLEPMYMYRPIVGFNITDDVMVMSILLCVAQFKKSVQIVADLYISHPNFLICRNSNFFRSRLSRSKFVADRCRFEYILYKLQVG